MLGSRGVPNAHFVRCLNFLLVRMVLVLGLPNIGYGPSYWPCKISYWGLSLMIQTILDIPKGVDSLVASFHSRQCTLSTQTFCNVDVLSWGESFFLDNVLWRFLWICGGFTIVELQSSWCTFCKLFNSFSLPTRMRWNCIFLLPGFSASCS